MTRQQRLDTAMLVPVKGFTRAKQRLAVSLNPAERATLAEAMLRDVVLAATGCAAVDRVILLGGADARRIAQEEGVRWLDDDAEPDLNQALIKAAANLAERGVAHLIVLPGDLPGVQSRDIAGLLACHEQGLTIRPARSDGGTNALVISPPDAIAFRFGPDSARQHLETALAAGLRAQKVDVEGFARDIDNPEDLRWLCSQAVGVHTSRWLTSHNLEQRFTKPAQTALRA